MQVIVTGRHTDVSARLKNHAVKKIEKVQRFFDRIQTLEIEFSEEHNPKIADKHTVEVTLVTKAHILRATGHGPDASSAIDAVVDKLEVQVKKLKEKMKKRRGGANGTKLRPPEFEPGTIELVNEPDGEPSGARITRVSTIEVKPMTPEEAILQMESLGHEFFLFVNAESQAAGVVYRRADGTFGLIESA